MLLNRFTFKHEVLFCLFITFAIIVIYGQAIDYEFIEFDDPEYIEENSYVQQGLTTEGLKWAFSFQEKGSIYWHPLTWLSHMADVTLFGNQAGLHHLMNVIWHMLNTCLFFLLLHRTTRMFWSSVLAASFFAVHPLNVESVAWIAERKNLLSTFFWLLSIATYVYYARSPGFIKYLLLVCIFVVGLMAKPMLITLPFVFLLLDYWPLERVSLSSIGTEKKHSLLIRTVKQVIPLLLEKLPLLCVAVLATYLVTESISEYNNIIPYSVIPLSLRVENLFVSYAAYVGKLVWPFDLTIFYPFPKSLSLLQVTISTLVLGGITFVILGPLREKKYCTVGWLWFVGTLTPVSGLIQAGMWPFMADRWAYVPYIGLFIILSWSITEYISHHRHNAAWLISAILLIIFILGTISWRQVHHWQNSVALYSHALSVNSRNSFVHYSFGVVLAEKGRDKEAIDHYNQALAINPDWPEVHYKLGVALVDQGRIEEAINHYYHALAINPGVVIKQNNLSVGKARKDKNEDVLQLYQRILRSQPNLFQIHNSLGTALMVFERFPEAILSFREALRIKPSFVEARNNLANAYFKIGNPEDAIIHFRKALEINSEELSFNNFASALMKTGERQEAIQYYKKALQQNPDDEKTLYHLGFALMDLKRYGEAILSFKEAFRVKPDYFGALNRLARIFAEQQQAEKGINQYLKALEINPQSEISLINLANILAEHNRHEEAIIYLTQYIQLPPKDNETHFSIAQKNTKSGYLEDVIDHYLQVVAVDPGHYESHLNLALLFDQFGNNEAAILHYNKALLLAPENAEIHYNLAHLLAAAGRAEEAKKHYARVLEINPTFVNAHNNLGILLAQENRTEQAISHFAKALRLDPTSIDGHTNMGTILFNLGKRDEARYHFQEAVKLSPENQHLQLLLHKASSM